MVAAFSVARHGPLSSSAARKRPGAADIECDCRFGGVAVTRVAYEADGWGEGELWFAGRLLVWHELPRPGPQRATPSEPRRLRTRPIRSGPVPQRPHPRAGGSTHHPLGSTIPAKDAPVGNAIAPNV